MRVLKETKINIEACLLSFGMQNFKRLKEAIKAVPGNYRNDVGQQGLLISLLLYGNEKAYVLPATIEQMGVIYKT